MIDAIELKRNFDNGEAVSGVNFRVHHGEIFGLLGPNGAGKNDHHPLTHRSDQPQGGRAIVDGCDVVNDRACLIERIGVVLMSRICTSVSYLLSASGLIAGSITCRKAGLMKYWILSVCASVPKARYAHSRAA
jgi:ABC-type Na+ transport system ATPase subunit NatA